ncbi:MAG: riboflavin kinase, partial [Muribaculaceae bacterium]|nr:riboflavin kinase [Muribaculaceae bacterium]
TVDTPDAPISVEAHLIGFSGNLYGSHLRIGFISRLRAERRFGSLDELRDAIAADVGNALSAIRQ